MDLNLNDFVRPENSRVATSSAAMDYERAYYERDINIGMKTQRAYGGWKIKN
jgi:hypothetical protein